MCDEWEIQSSLVLVSHTFVFIRHSLLHRCVVDGILIIPFTTVDNERQVTQPTSMTYFSWLHIIISSPSRSRASKLNFRSGNLPGEITLLPSSAAGRRTLLAQ